MNGLLPCIWQSAHCVKEDRCQAWSPDASARCKRSLQGNWTSQRYVDYISVDMSMPDRDTDASHPADTPPPVAAGGWKQQARFESLLADISTHLLNVPAEAVDEQIVDALRQLVMHLEVDRGSISIVDPGDGHLRTSHSWSAAALSPIPMGLGE